MGMLDFVPMEEYKPPKDTSKVDLRCDRCTASFIGHEWLVKKKGEVICPRCWKEEQEISEMM